MPALRETSLFQITQVFILRLIQACTQVWQSRERVVVRTVLRSSNCRQSLYLSAYWCKVCIILFHGQMRWDLFWILLKTSVHLAQTLDALVLYSHLI